MGLVRLDGLAGGSGLGAVAYGRIQYLMALTGDPVKKYEYGKWLDAHGREQDALMWMSEAADHNEPRAMFWLGMAYLGGGAIAYPDPKQSFYWLKEASNRNILPAIVVYAGMFEGSPYVRKQVSPLEADTAAKVWYMRAANSGVGFAIDRMVKVYENGELGEEKSKQEADDWRKAKRKPDEYWKEQLK